MFDTNSCLDGSRHCDDKDEDLLFTPHQSYVKALRTLVVKSKLQRNQDCTKHQRMRW